MSPSLTIKLVRHGQSQANVGLVTSSEVGDHTIALTEDGHQQARAVGASLGPAWLGDALVYCSPYRRTRQTLRDIITGAGLEPDQVRIFEDPRLREVEHGYAEYEAQLERRRTHGWFYYRFEGGESPADCYDRVSGFLETLMRQVGRRSAERVLIVTHGLALRCFVMRFLHLTVEEFERMKNPGNGAVVTLAPRGTLAKYGYATDGWEVDGLELYSG